MTTLKSAIATLTICLFLASTTFASNNPITMLSKSLRTELSSLVQNPELAKNNLTQGKIDVSFSIDHAGKINVLNSNSLSPYLIDFVQKKLDGQQLDNINYIPGKTYAVRFSFELE